jgi:aminopeptidase YwaD
MAHGTPKSFPIPGAKVSLRADVQRTSAPTRNVIGMIEGSDPVLKKEVVVIGAHYDHLGFDSPHSLAPRGPSSAGDAKEIHHGADDNASGTAGILELADYLSANRKKLGRSIVLMGFSGEEIGLIGSAHWTNKPTIPLDRVVAMINLDMIGRMRNDTVTIIGAGSSTAWPGLLKEVNKPYRLQAKADAGSGFGGSDHQSFLLKNIPVLFFFTGVHPDYHKPSDTWDKVNPDGIVKISSMVADAAIRLSTAKERPKFVKVKETARPAGPGGFRVRLGTIPDYSGGVEGVLISGVQEGGPAQKGGMLGGDIIVEFDGKSVRNVEEYTAVLSTAEPNVPVKIVVLRKKERVTLTVTPAPTGR